MFITANIMYYSVCIYTVLSSYTSQETRILNAAEVNKYYFSGSSSYSYLKKRKEQKKLDLEGVSLDTKTRRKYVMSLKKKNVSIPVLTNLQNKSDV